MAHHNAPYAARLLKVSGNTRLTQIRFSPRFQFKANVFSCSLSVFYWKHISIIINFVIDVDAAKIQVSEHESVDVLWRWDAGNWTFYAICLPTQGELRNVAEKYAILFLWLIIIVSINYVPTQEQTDGYPLCVRLSAFLTLQVNSFQLLINALTNSSWTISGGQGSGNFNLDKKRLIASFTSLLPVTYLHNWVPFFVS